jgi:hypothetical protein
MTGAFRLALWEAGEEVLAEGETADAFVVTRDAEGQRRDAVAARGPAFDEGQRIVVSSTGRLAMTGQFSDSLDYQGETLEAPDGAAFVITSCPAP